jgi:hypothetical protein
MSKLPEMGRVLHEHNWHVPMEWARMLEELGNLSDNEIEQLVNEKNRFPPTPDPDGISWAPTHHEFYTLSGWRVNEVDGN